MTNSPSTLESLANQFTWNSARRTPLPSAESTTDTCFLMERRLERHTEAWGNSGQRVKEFALMELGSRFRHPYEVS